MDPKFFAVIPAAGKGTRMGTRENKQFLDLNGIPVLARTLLAFQNISKINGIIISCSPDEKEKTKALCRKYKIEKLISVVDGGPERLDSVLSALECLASLSPDLTGEPYVLIHDGARPLISEQLISSSMENVVKYGACICAVPVKDTIKTGRSDGYVLSTVPRENLFAVQTPQSFKLKTILDIYRKMPKDRSGLTDDASAAEYFGVKVKMIPGDNINIKITTADDLIFARTILGRY